MPSWTTVIPKQGSLNRAQSHPLSSFQEALVSGLERLRRSRFRSCLIKAQVCSIAECQDRCMDASRPLEQHLNPRIDPKTMSTKTFSINLVSVRPPARRMSDSFFPPKSQGTRNLAFVLGDRRPSYQPALGDPPFGRAVHGEDRGVPATPRRDHQRRDRRRTGRALLDQRRPSRPRSRLHASARRQSTHMVHAAPDRTVEP